MPTIAIVGAGSGLGQSVAKAFARKGFDVALIARDAERLAKSAAELGAAAFPADVLDRVALADALAQAAAHFGGIDVLEYAVPPSGFVAAPEVTVENLRPQLDLVCHGAIAAARAVLPGMLDAGRGTLLFTTGASSVNPLPVFGAAGIAGAALRNWALSLHAALGSKGVYVAHVTIGTWIRGTPAPEGAVTTDPDDIADVYWDLYVARDQAERLILP